MGSTGLIILLVALGLFLFVGISSTSNLIDSAKTSNDNATVTGATGAGGVIGPLWSVLMWGIIIVSMYCLIYAFSHM